MQKSSNTKNSFDFCSSGAHAFDTCLSAGQKSRCGREQRTEANTSGICGILSWNLGIPTWIGLTIDCCVQAYGRFGRRESEAS